MVSSSSGARGMGRSYWPKERRARWPTIEPAVMPSMVGPIICMSGPIHAIGSAALGRSSTGSSASSWCRAAGQLLEQRSVGVERQLGATRAGDGHDGDAPAGDRGGQPGGVGDLEVGHAGELLDLDAVERVDVGLGGVAGGDRQRQLAGGVPVDRSLLLEQLGQVAEQRHALERVVVPEGIAAGGAGVAHLVIVGGSGSKCVLGRCRASWPDGSRAAGQDRARRSSSSVGAGGLGRRVGRLASTDPGVGPGPGARRRPSPLDDAEVKTALARGRRGRAPRLGRPGGPRRTAGRRRRWRAHGAARRGRGQHGDAPS